MAAQSVTSPEPEFKPAEQIQRTAVHEAGHAVIGRVLKQVCGQASVRPSPDEGEAGHAITADPYVTLGYWLDDLGRWRGRDSTVSIMRGRVMTFMAGRYGDPVLAVGRGVTMTECEGDEQRQSWLGVRPPAA